MSYPGHSLRESYPSAEMQLMYSTAPANRAKKYIYIYIYNGKSICQWSGRPEFNPRLSHTKDSKKKKKKKKKRYLMSPCLTPSIIRYRSRVKWSNPGNGVGPSPISRCSSYWKGSLWVALNYGRQLYIYIYIYIYIYAHTHTQICQILAHLKHNHKFLSCLYCWYIS